MDSVGGKLGAEDARGANDGMGTSRGCGDRISASIALEMLAVLAVAVRCCWLAVALGESGACGGSAAGGDATSTVGAFFFFCFFAFSVAATSDGRRTRDGSTAAEAGAAEILRRGSSFSGMQSGGAGEGLVGVVGRGSFLREVRAGDTTAAAAAAAVRAARSRRRSAAMSCRRG